MAEVSPSTTQTAHGSVWNKYNTSYLADLEDSYWENNAQDEGILAANLYYKHLRETILRNPNSTILEVGTGPGRVLFGLAQRAAQDGLDLSDAHFIGLDNAAAQVALAQQRSPQMTNVGSVDWVLADACSFASHPACAQLAGKVQFMPIFNFGSIFHLNKHEQTPRLFEQVARTLEPETGVACVSLQDINISARSASRGKGAVDVEAMLAELETARWESVRFPGIVYSSVGEGSERGDGCLTIKHRTQVIQKDAEGRETVLEEHFESMKQTCWAEEEFVALMAKHGLTVTGTVEGVWETFYLLKLSGRQQ